MEEDLEVILESEQEMEVGLEEDALEIVTSNYEELNNKPSINNVELLGDKTSKDLGLQEEMESLSNLEIEEILKI